jgi:hypothetical protein
VNAGADVTARVRVPGGAGRPAVELRSRAPLPSTTYPPPLPSTTPPLHHSPLPSTTRPQSAHVASIMRSSAASTRPHSAVERRVHINVTAASASASADADAPM